MWLLSRLAPDKQLSTTNPDARCMQSRGTGIVGYSVQTAVDAAHHLIVAYEVTHRRTDRDFLLNYRYAPNFKHIVHARFSLPGRILPG